MKTAESFQEAKKLYESKAKAAGAKPVNKAEEVAKEEVTKRQAFNDLNEYDVEPVRMGPEIRAAFRQVLVEQRFRLAWDVVCLGMWMFALSFVLPLIGLLWVIWLNAGHKF